MKPYCVYIFIEPFSKNWLKNSDEINGLYEFDIYWERAEILSGDLDVSKENLRIKPLVPGVP